MEKIETLNKENINELRAKLSQKGFKAEEIDSQLVKLNDLIMLSTLKRLAQAKNINLNDVKFAEGETSTHWLTKNFTDQEIADATFEASRSTLTQYLKVLEG